MLTSPLVNWILRGFQILFGIVVLGLSITLIRGHNVGSLPSSLGFSAFTGGITIVAALLGLAATWFSFLEGIIGIAIDGLVTLINLVGGIVLVVKVKDVKCKWGSVDDSDNRWKLANNDLFNGGGGAICGQFEDGDYGCYLPGQTEQDGSKLVDIVTGHCRESSAAMVFMFLTAALFLASGLMLFLRKRKGY